MKVSSKGIGKHMEQLHRKQSLLLHQLLEEKKPMTSHQLSLVVDVSIRTIKTYIQEINQKIQPCHIRIASKAREGYWMEYEEGANLEGVVALLDKNVVQKYDDTPKYNYERINYIIKKLLVIDYHIKLEDLMDEIYVSRSTLTQDLKQVRSLLTKFRLKVITRANYGIIIEGDEIDKRLCIAEYFFHFNERANYEIESENMFSRGKGKEEYDQIVRFIREICEQFHIMISDFSLNNLAVHVSVGMRRCTFYNYVKDDQVQDMHDCVEFRAADALVKKLEQAFGCMLPIGETMYYALHLQSKRILDETILSETERSKIKECIEIILAEVKDNFELDFDQDEELYRYLYVHIPQMITRLRNHMVIRNPLVYDNLRRYLFATKVTHSACAVIEHIYDVEVDINEFGYLVLYFHLAITKFQNRKKIRIGFLSGRGRPEFIMYLNEIREYLSQGKYVVEEIDTNELDHIANRNIDFLITTFMLKESLAFPVYVIKNDSYLEEIRRELNVLQYRRLDFQSYFKPEFCLFDFPGSSKEEVLDNFYNILYQRNYIKRKPELQDQFKYNELGKGIVHFQDLHRIARQEMCLFVMLSKPILWDQDVVKILIFSKTKRDGDKDLPVLCSILSRWADQVELVDHFLNTKDANVLMNELQEVW